MTNNQKLRTNLPPLPIRMQHLSLDARGYPVPWFVQWFNGKPDFRVVDANKFRQAIRFNNCWICGERLGSRKTFVLGPMSVLSRVTSEPGSHYECAEFAACACPFLVLPASQYRTATLPENTRMPAGNFLSTRNPGVCALWTATTFRIRSEQTGPLIEVGIPTHVEWWHKGGYASRKIVRSSIDAGLTEAFKLADNFGVHRAEYLIELANSYWRAEPHLPDHR